MRKTVYLLLLSTVALVLTLAAGCDEGEPPPDSCDDEAAQGPVALVHLVDAEAWTPSDLDDDPLHDHQPDTVVCPLSAWSPEFGVTEVSTGACNYWSVEQPLAAAIREGDPLRVQMWWQSLISAEPATGHVAVLIDGALVWEIHVEIPGPSEAREWELLSPISAEPGATVTLHLHNHGANTWTFADLARLAPAAMDDGTTCE